MNKLMLYVGALPDWDPDTPRQAMNFLQERGIISDLCVNTRSVPHCDCDRAIAALRAFWPGVGKAESHR